MFDFLNHKQEKAILPTATGDYSKSLVGRWYAQLFYTILSAEDLVKLFDGFKPDATQDFGVESEWTAYHFLDYDVAVRWLVETEAKYKSPNQNWVLQAMTSDVLNLTDEGKSKFGQAIVKSVRVSSPASRDHRHEALLISLPAAVAAYADVMGWENPGYPLDELDTEDIAFTDDYSAYLIGHPDARESDAKAFNIARDLATATFGDKARDVVRRLVCDINLSEGLPSVPVAVTNAIGDVAHLHWTNSLFYDRREALWNALDEKNRDVYQPYGSTTAKGKPSKFACQEDNKLSKALDILSATWESAVWARVNNVFNPAPAAISNRTGKRLEIPCIVKIYKTVEEAQADVANDNEEEGVAPVAVSTPVGTQLPPVPSAWVDENGTPIKDAWVAQVREMKKKYPGPLPLFKNQVEAAEATGVLNEENSCTAADAIAWYPFA